MRPMLDMDPCEQAEQVSVYALRALPAIEASAVDTERISRPSS